MKKATHKRQLRAGPASQPVGQSVRLLMVVVVVVVVMVVVAAVVCIACLHACSGWHTVEVGTHRHHIVMGWCTPCDACHEVGAHRHHMVTGWCTPCDACHVVRKEVVRIWAMRRRKWRVCGACVVRACVCGVCVCVGGYEGAHDGVARGHAKFTLRNKLLYFERLPGCLFPHMHIWLLCIRDSRHLAGPPERP